MIKSRLCCQQTLASLCWLWWWEQVTGRSYLMLSEECVKFGRKTWWFKTRSRLTLMWTRCRNALLRLRSKGQNSHQGETRYRWDARKAAKRQQQHLAAEDRCFSAACAPLFSSAVQSNITKHPSVLCVFFFFSSFQSNLSDPTTISSWKMIVPPLSYQFSIMTGTVLNPMIVVSAICLEVNNMGPEHITNLLQVAVSW